MSNVAVHKVRNLQAPARQTVEELLGRELGDDEEVTVLAFPPHRAPSPHEREALAARLSAVMDRASDKAAEIPDDQLEQTIDEAMRHVRPREP